MTFTRQDLARATSVKLLRNGRVANACVSLVELDGRRWTLKDFSSRPWIVRKLVAPFVLRRELRALAPLSGIEGVASEAFPVDGEAIAIEFIPGDVLAHVPEETITAEYLEDLERLMRTIHSRGVVHLDTRGSSNIVMMPNGRAGIIDFQAGFRTGWLPGFLRRLLEDFDMSGVYKKWMAWCPDAMGQARRAEYERLEKLRRWWVFKGYFGLKKHRKKKKKQPPQQ